MNNKHKNQLIVFESFSGDGGIESSEIEFETD